LYLGDGRGAPAYNEQKHKDKNADAMHPVNLLFRVAARKCCKQITLIEPCSGSKTNPCTGVGLQESPPLVAIPQDR
jgi:hypothetical protein